MDSERRSLTSPNHRIVQRRWTDPDEDPRSRDSLRSKNSRADMSEAGLSSAFLICYVRVNQAELTDTSAIVLPATPSEKGQHAAKAAPVAVGEFKEFIR